MLNLASLYMRRRRNDLLTVYKIINGVVDLKTGDLFIFVASSTRGHITKLFLGNPRTSLRRTFFAFRAGADHVKLCKQMQLSKSFSAFKRDVYRYLQEKH